MSDDNETTESEGAQPVEAVPTKEPFDVWWPKYIQQVRESVTAAEEYLEVPNGTISSIVSDTDFVATVKVYAVIEPILNDWIAKHPPRVFSLSMLGSDNNPDENYRSFVASLPLSGGRATKLSLAEGQGLLSKDDVLYIKAVSSVRNRYAHNVKNIHRSLEDIAFEEQQSNQKIVQHLTGMQDVKLPSSLGPYIKMFMYHRLSDCLSKALHTLKPPPLPQGGLLGGLYGLGEVFPLKTDETP